MLARRLLRLAVVGALEAAKTANSFNWTIDSPGNWATPEDSLADGYAQILVRCGDETKAGKGPNIPAFDTDCIIEVEARLKSVDRVDLQDQIEALGYTIENILLTDYSLGLAVQQFTSIHTRTEITSEGREQLAGLFMAFGMQAYEVFDAASVPPAATTWPLVASPLVPLKTIGLMMDLQNVFDPNGTYLGAEFPDSVVPAPRSYGPDGRVEAGFTLDVSTLE